MTLQLDHTKFFVYMHQYLTTYLKEATLNFWTWKLQRDLSLAGITMEQLKDQLNREKNVSMMVVESYMD
jgi:hypothetical protein